MKDSERLSGANHYADRLFEFNRYDIVGHE
jgi:hypothetical protein